MSAVYPSLIPESLEGVRAMVVNMNLRQQMLYLVHLKSIVLGDHLSREDMLFPTMVAQLWLINASLADRQEALRRMRHETRH